jgi:hypothetical protein
MMFVVIVPGGDAGGMMPKLLPPIDMDAEIAEKFERFERNREYAAEKRAELLQAHPHEWFAVWDEGQLLVDTEFERLMERLPDEARATAVIGYLDPDPLPLIL